MKNLLLAASLVFFLGSCASSGKKACCKAKTEHCQDKEKCKAKKDCKDKKKCDAKKKKEEKK